MEQIGERVIWHYVPGTNVLLPLGGVNALTVFSTVVVIGVLLTLLRLGARKCTTVPGRFQMAVELYVGAFDDLVSSSLELETQQKNRRFLPLIASLFLFLLFSNFMGFFPFPYLEEPTGDINTTLALGFMGMAIALYCSIKVKGVGGYFEELLGPMWAQEGVRGLGKIAGKLSALFFFPLNMIGEMAKVISISFRLFGNITGGGIIIVVVSHLIYYMALPIGMDLFFVFFAGTVQAFVFSMLTLTYISMAIK